MSNPSHLLLRLAIAAPLRQYFDYLPPEGSAGSEAAPGVRVRAPFGQRKLVGVLVERVEEGAVETGKLRHAIEVLDDAPLLPPSIIELCRWSAQYYQHPIGEVFAAALTPSLRDGKALPTSAWHLTRRGQGLGDDALRRAPAQARVLSLLREQTVSHEALRGAGVSSATLRELANKGLIERCVPAPTLPSADLRRAGPELNAQQRRVIDSVPLDGFACHLLQGVTGSGKTEVYLQLIARCLAAGRQALVLVPEIGLTPQTVARFEARFCTPVAVLHSGLAEGQRLAAWQAARSGGAGIVIGTRSAVFTALARPGLIVVDEEHDASFKQQDGFRYSARDVAIKRAQLESCPVLLGSATPALESLHNVERGRYRHHILSQRAGGGVLPDLQVIDLRGRRLTAGLSDPLLAALRETVEDQGRQALLFLNRRGYAPTLQCHDCGWVAGCEHCDARLTVHLRRRSLRCHHCGAASPLPAACPDCASRSLLTHGLGTEQIEEALAREINCPIHRVDSDSMRGRDAMQSLIDIALGEEPCVILGTQMLTKGHHFPAVQLVGIIDADALLYSADFRGEERMAQLVTQVSGRAGREMAGGRVLLQTHYPDDPLFPALRDGNLDAVAATLLQKRRQARLPPYGQLSLVRADSRSEGDGDQFLRELRRRAEPALAGDSRLIGPLPSSMPRRAGRFRWQLWCLSGDRRSASAAARLLVAAAQEITKGRDLSWFIDVDPIDVI